MIPANTFSGAMIPPDWQRPPALSGLASPLTWIEGVFGVESPADMVTDAQNNLNSALNSLVGTQTTIQALLVQAQAYDSSSDQTVLGKAQAAESQATGLINALQSLQTSAQSIQNQITPAQANPSIDKQSAQNLKDAVSALASQISAFVGSISQLQKDVNTLKSVAQSGPGFTGALENTALSSISTLTWIIGGGAMIYFLAPTFIPRMVRGLRKSS